MGRSRGQVILIAALGIAVTLVALALITNTAIYTENLATRSTVNGQDAVAFHQSMEEGATGLLSLANRYNASDHNIIESQFEADIANLSASTEIESVRHGDLATVSLVNTTKGARISQNETGNFTNTSSVGDWELADDVSQTRQFELNVTRSQLNESDPFTVIVSNGSAQWSAEISGNSSDVIVTVSNGTDSTCSVATESAVIDLTEGTMEDTSCEWTGFASNIEGSYNISFENGKNGYGRYVLFVDRDSSDIDDTNYETNPSLDPALYDATIHVSVTQPDLTYETNVTIAPEKSPEGEVYGIVP